MIGLNKISTIPCRAEATDKAEMVSQFLYGETYDVIEEKEKWVRVKSHTDLYESWIPREQHFESPHMEERYLLTLFDSYLTLDDRSTIQLSPGSRLTKAELSMIQTCSSLSHDPAERINAIDLLSYARKFLGTPYLWGGRSKWGIDCSGFIQILMLVQGMTFPRDASQQAEIGRAIDFETRKAGDLAYFKNPVGKITHVGLLIDAHHIIHASGWVRIDSFDRNGILKKEIGTYSHALSHINRITF